MKHKSWASGFTLFLLTTFCVIAAPLDVWHWRNPTPQGNTLESIAYGNGRLVAAGNGGLIMVSTNDGATWQMQIRLDENEFPIWMRHVAFGNGVFVGVDYNSAYTSTNGVDWTWRAYVAGGSLDFCGGQFIALGQSSVISTSPDGVDWAVTVLPAVYWLEGAASGNGTTIVVGIGGVIVANTNGVDWVPVDSGTNSWLTTATWDGSRFLVAGWDGALLVSSNGLNWTNLSFTGQFPPYFLSSVSHNGRTVLAGQVMAVVEGDTKQITLSQLYETLLVEDVIVANNVFWAIGEGGAIRRSTNGYDWVEVSMRVPDLPTLTSLNGVVFDGTKFVAVGDYYILVSSNGVNWSKLPAFPEIRGNDIALGNGRFVIAGSDYSHPLTHGLASSADGTNWVTHGLPLGTFEQFFRVKFLNGHFIAVGNMGAVALSTNGMNWSVKSLGSNLWLHAVGYGEGKYLIGGQQESAVFISSNAVNWTSNHVAFADGYWDFAYGRNRFVAAYYRSGFSEGLAWSPDGLNWTSQPGHAERVIYQGGVFIAAGFSRLSTSFNGRQFTLRNPIYNRFPRGIAFGHQTFVLVGEGASIIQSGPVPPAFMLDVKIDGPSSGPLLRLDSPVDGNYDVQHSSDSKTWATFTTVQSTNGAFQIRAPKPNGTAFYRAILQP